MQPHNRIERCAALVRDRDRGRYVATLVLPAGKRVPFWALYGLFCHLTEIRARVRNEDMAGMLRLQWWHDEITKIYAGKAVAKQDILAVLADLHGRGALPWHEEQLHGLVTLFADDFTDTAMETVSARQADRLHRRGACVTALAQAIVADGSGRLCNDLPEKAGAFYQQTMALANGLWVPEERGNSLVCLQNACDGLPQGALAHSPALLPVFIAAYYLRRLQKSGARVETKAGDIMRYYPLASFYMWRKYMLRRR